MHTGSAVAHLKIVVDTIGALQQIDNFVWVTDAADKVAVLGVDGTTKVTANATTEVLSTES